MNLDQSYLKSILNYNPETGVFTNRITRSSRAKAGAVAGGVNSNGYRHIRIHNRLYKAHRLAFLYMTGEFPSNDVDHINGIRDDNRWKELRPVSKSENNKNTKKPKANTSGVMGVWWRKDINKWRVQIKVFSKNIYLGHYSDFFEACCLRKSAELEHGYHPNHGR